jgi:alkyl hydroperoxide reductase subunit AhpC
MEWTKKPREQGGLGPIDIPLIADINKEVSAKYGVLNDAGISFRGTFIIDDNQVVKHLSINDLPVGRNVDEYLRLVKVLFFVNSGFPIQR